MTEQLIIRQKEIYEAQVERFFQFIKRCFNEAIDSNYNERLIKSIENKHVLIDRDDIRIEFLNKESAILGYIFENEPTSEKIVVTLPGSRQPNSQFTIFISKPETKQFTKDDIIALREYYKKHILQHYPIDYRQISVDVEKLPADNNQINWLVLAGALVNYFNWITGHIDVMDSKFDSIKVDTELESMKNVFNDMPLKEVYKYFEPLVNQKGRSQQFYLTNIDLMLFIKVAFCGEPISVKLTFNIGRGDLGKISYFFYQYFEICSVKKGYQANKDQYVKLLTDNFSNFNYNSVFSNFNKRPKNIIKKH